MSFLYEAPSGTSAAGSKRRGSPAPHWSWSGEHSATSPGPKAGSMPPITTTRCGRASLEQSLRTFGGLRAFDRLNYGGAMALRRPPGGVTASKISFRDAGALGEQSLNDFQVPVTRGNHERRHAVFVLGIDGDPNVEKELHDLGLIALSRQMQRRIAELIPDVEFCFRLDEDCDDLEVAIHRRVMQRGTRLVIGLIGIGAALDQQFDMRRIVLGCCTSQ